MRRVASALPLVAATLLGAASARAGEPDRLVAGYTARSFQDVYVEDGKRVFRVSVERFLRKTAPDMEVQLRIFDGPADLAEALRNKRVDLAGFTPNQIVEMSREVALEPAFVTESASGVYEDAVLLVKSDSPFARLADLGGKRLMILEGAEGGHHEVWLDTWALRDTGKPMRSLFSVIGNGRTSSQTILACFFATVEACLAPRGAFDLSVELNPQVGKNLRVLGSSKGIPGAVIAFRPDFDPRLKARMSDIIAHVHEDPLGLQILTLFRQRRLAAFQPGFLAGMEALVREHAERLKAYHGPGRTP